MLSSLYRPAPCVFLSAVAAVMLPVQQGCSCRNLGVHASTMAGGALPPRFRCVIRLLQFSNSSLPCKAATYLRLFMLGFQTQPSVGEFNSSLQPKTQCALCLSQRPQQQTETETQMLAFRAHSHLFIRNVMLPRRR